MADCPYEPIKFIRATDSPVLYKREPEHEKNKKNIG